MWYDRCSKGKFLPLQKPPKPLTDNEKLLIENFEKGKKMITEYKQNITHIRVDKDIKKKLERLKDISKKTIINDVIVLLYSEYVKINKGEEYETR